MMGLNLLMKFTKSTVVNNGTINSFSLYDFNCYNGNTVLVGESSWIELFSLLFHVKQLSNYSNPDNTDHRTFNNKHQTLWNIWH